MFSLVIFFSFSLISQKALFNGKCMKELHIERLCTSLASQSHTEHMEHMVTPLRSSPWAHLPGVCKLAHTNCVGAHGTDEHTLWLCLVFRLTDSAGPTYLILAHSSVSALHCTFLPSYAQAQLNQKPHTSVFCFWLTADMLITSYVHFVCECALVPLNSSTQSKLRLTWLSE